MVGTLLSGLWQGASSLYSSSKQEQAAAKIASAEEQAQAVEKRYQDWAANNTGTAAANGAWNMAKSKTGTLASQTSQSQAYASQNAQQNAGINKAQAAMSSQNASTNNYADIYNDQFEINREAATEALDQANESMRIGSEQEAANIRNAAKAEAEELLSGDLATDIGKQLSSDFSDIWSSVTSSDFWFGKTSEKTKQQALEAGANNFYSWAKNNSRNNQAGASLWNILNSGKAWSDLSKTQRSTLYNMVDTYSKTGGGDTHAASNLQDWYGKIQNWLSDERCKEFEEASLADCINSLFDTLSKLNPNDNYTKQEYDTLLLVYDFVDVLVKIARNYGKSS